MKFLHLGDLHLGKSLGDFDLIGDQRYMLDQILGIIDKREVDAVLIAGDVYDKSIPSEAATAILDYFLNRLSDRKVACYIISGNHDSDERLNFGSELFEANNIFISSKFDGTLHKYVINDKDLRVNLFLLPFVKASQVRHFYPEAEINSYDDAIRTIIDNTQIDPDECNILIAHQFVAGKGEDPALGGSESAGTQSVGLVEKIGYDCFDMFDYVALGHIHSPQRVGRDEVRYSGSMLKYSLSEVNNNKSVPIITVSSGEKLKFELEPLKPMRDLRHLKGPLKALLAKENVTSPEDFIYVTLTDEDFIDDAMGIFQQTYPNTVKIDYDNSRTKNVENVDVRRLTERVPFSELIGDFYRLMYGTEISDEEMAVMKQAAREAGVPGETD